MVARTEAACCATEVNTNMINPIFEAAWMYFLYIPAFTCPRSWYSFESPTECACNWAVVLMRAFWKLALCFSFSDRTKACSLKVETPSLSSLGVVTVPMTSGVFVPDEAFNDWWPFLIMCISNAFGRGGTTLTRALISHYLGLQEGSGINPVQGWCPVGCKEANRNVWWMWCCSSLRHVLWSRVNHEVQWHDLECVRNERMNGEVWINIPNMCRATWLSTAARQSSSSTLFKHKEP